MIENDEQLRDATWRAGNLLQEITDYVKRHPEQRDNARIRFPRGFLRTIDENRRKLGFIDDRVLRSNVGYAIMAHDVLRWVAFYTDLSGQAREMVIKEAVCLLGSICESITIFPDERGLGRNKSFRRRLERMLELEIVDQATYDNVIWLWDKRNQEHLYDVPFREFSHYVSEDWYRSVEAYNNLRASLDAWRKPVAKRQ